MKSSISSSPLGRRSLSALRRAANIALFQELEQRQMLSVTPLGPVPSSTENSNPSAFYAVNGTQLFFADDSTGTQHLYKTDGTAAGTQLVSTQSLDSSTSGGADVAVSGNNLFYITDTGNGQEIEEASVASGGAVTVSQFSQFGSTSDTTQPVNNLDRYSIEGIGAVGNKVYFSVDDNTNATGDTTPYTLWVTDGTSAGTINLGSFAEINEISGINGKAIIAANNGVDGEMLWVSDGTKTGTVELQASGGGDIFNPADFTADGTNLFFGDQNGGLYYTNGTQAGTKQVSGLDYAYIDGTATDPTDEHLSVVSGDVYYRSDDYLYKTSADGSTTTEVANNVYGISDITPVGTHVFFRADDATHGYEVFESDGTTITLVPGVDSGTSGTNPQNLTGSGNELFFEAQPHGEEYEIFATDGTTTKQLTEDFTGDGFEQSISGVGDGTAYITYDDNFHGNEPWKLTATTANLLADVNTTPDDESETPNDWVQVGNEVYFVSGQNSSDNQTLWKTDGTAAGTMEIGPQGTITSGSTTINVPLVRGLSISNLIAGSSVLYFESNADGTSNALWMYNGTTAAPVQYIPTGQTTPVDITAGENTAVIGNTLYFDFNDGTHGDELWKTDGTTAGTVLVKDINTVVNGSLTNSSNPENLEVLGTKLLFTADSGSGEMRELWMSDGTAAGTMVIKHLETGDTSSFNFDDYQAVGSVAYFVVDYDGRQLWKTDGTSAGTMALGTFDSVDLSGSGGEDVAPMIGNDFFFEAEPLNSTNNFEGLWKTDGTVAGTVLVKNAAGESGGLDPSDMINLNPTTIVFEGNGPAGEELWKSDGTTAGTVQVADINPGSAESDPYDLVVLNGEAYFGATSGPNGTAREDYELWKSDGTAAGTQKVTQIFTSNDGNYGDNYGADVDNITIVGSKIFFTADNSTNGTELWESDGTAAGTAMVQDINPNTSSYPDDLATVTDANGDNVLVFFADNGTQGDQPYSVVIPNYNVSVSATTLSVPENGTGTFNVVLTAAPTANVTVTIAKESGGSADLTTTATTLTFTPQNWDDPQAVTVAGAIADGALNGTATFDITADNISPQTVVATETANTTDLLVITPTAVNVNEGGTSTFNVHLTTAPVGPLTVTVAFASGGSVLSTQTSTLTFNATNWNVDQAVTLASGTDADTTNDVATFSVSTPGFPVQTVTATQIDTSGPKVGTFTVTPSSGTSKSTIKLIATDVTGDNGTGSAANVRFYFDTNSNGVFDSGDALLKTVKVKKGKATDSFKAPKTLTTGAHDFFAVAVDSSGLAGQAATGTFTLNAVTARLKKASLRAASVAAPNIPASDLSSTSVTQNLFSQTPILD